MNEHFKDGTPWEQSDVEMRPLEEGDPPHGFECGAEDQNKFLYERAWRDTCKSISVTHTLYIKGVLAAYVTLMNDRIMLGPRERAKGVTYQLVPALKIAQVAVDTRFQGFGLGMYMVGYAVEMAMQFRALAGCRYVTLDADVGVVTWYERQGFKVNKEEQAFRLRLAAERGRRVDQLAISMRFDLRDAREFRPQDELPPEGG